MLEKGNMFTRDREMLQEGERDRAPCVLWTWKLTSSKKMDQLENHRVLKWGRGPIIREHEETKNYSLYKP